MDKAKSLVFVNMVLFASICVQAASGFALAITGLALAYLIHKYNAVLMLVILIAHLVFNWGWIKVVVLKRR
ncbi:MAG TPA: hypothetical protein PLJ26_00705 [Candidatus Omnitrophota bacterium]|nr:hypothetical protein [Candidatus Omnitrophota bacterium]